MTLLLMLHIIDEKHQAEFCTLASETLFPIQLWNVNKGNDVFFAGVFMKGYSDL